VKPAFFAMLSISAKVYASPAGVVASIIMLKAASWLLFLKYLDDLEQDKSSEAVWPFDSGQANFIILNRAIDGDYPRPPNSSTPFPSEMLINYVRIYTN
jgi:hypothetical protein